MIGASGKLLSTSAKPVLNEMIPAIETGITTSKALSILVTSPSELEKQEDLLVAAAAEEHNGLPTVDEKKGQAPSKLMSIHELAELPKNEATSATSAVLVHKPLEANAPRDAVLHSDSIAKDLDTQKTEVSLTVPQEQELESGSIMETDSTEKNTIDDLNTVETQDTEEISPEEHEAVRKSTKFINMKELLQLTFQKLLEDDYLLSIPVSVPARRVTMDGEVKDWIQWNALVHPSKVEHVLARIERIGVGTMAGSITVLPVELCRAAHLKEEEPEEQSDDDSLDSVKAAKGTVSQNTGNKLVEQVKEDQLLERARSEWKNAATRLRIEQVRELIVEQAEFSFDYLSLLSVASILAGVGLITNNTVVIVASMLVSPIMGPVLGLTFGSRILDWSLVRTSLRNELLSLLGCVAWGVLIGLGASFTSFAEDSWPTNEMEIRGEASGLLTGIAIAIPSGMGVCLSVLGGNTSSLVGVAISASLLPPAVNTGICWVYAIFLSAGAVNNDLGRSGADFAVLGSISFALTALNILCIWISGLLMFEIKEVAPTEQKSAFWAKDIKVARELNSAKQKKEVDMTVVKDALKTQLNRRRQGTDKPIHDIEWLDTNRHNMYAVGSPTFSLDSRFTLQPQRMRYTKSDSEADRRSYSTKEDVKYVSVEDVASLLGLQGEDEDYLVEPSAVTSRIGLGRYL